MIPYVEDFQVIPKDIDGNIVFPVCTSCSNLENTKGGQSESKKKYEKGTYCRNLFNCKIAKRSLSLKQED